MIGLFELPPHVRLKQLVNRCMIARRDFQNIVLVKPKKIVAFYPEFFEKELIESLLAGERRRLVELITKRLFEILSNLRTIQTRYFVSYDVSLEGNSMLMDIEAFVFGGDVVC